MSDSSPNDGDVAVLTPTIKVTFDRNNSSSSRNRAISVDKNRRASVTKSIEEPDESHEVDKKAQEEVVASLRRFEESPSINFEPAPPVQFQPMTSDLPPANPLISTEKYSMEADMIFGWKPKFIMKAPIPLKFTSSMVEDIVNTLRYEQKSEQFPELIYSGFRPENSFFLHHRFSSPETYIFKLPPTLQSRHAMYWKMMNNTVNPARPFVGMKNQVAADCLNFDAIFEHGNLDVAIRKAKDEYDLYLRVDSNTRGHTCWYYFKVQNMQKGQTVKFNICNLSRTDSLYQRGMKPYVHSKRLSEEKKVGWEQTGENITYKPSHISYLSQHFDEEYSQKRYHKLSFEYTFLYDDDTVSFALCIPYTYSQLLQYIQTLTDSQKPEEGIENSHICMSLTYCEACVTSSKLCTSLGGVHVPLLTITDPDESEIPLCKRQYVVCSARVHPGETNSSWMMQGFITELCKDNAAAKYLRKKFIFKIVPMLNPDGVIVGNHRTGICGNDLNRQYISPQAVLHPSIVALKDLIRDLGEEKKNSVFAYFDFHGHSLMKNVFMYGAEFPIHTLNYYRIKILPMIISKSTPMFRFRACTFTIPKCKLATARAVFSMHYGITHCYTIEASYASYLNADKENVPFNQESYMGMGIAVAGGICEYKKLIEEEEIHALTLKFKQEIELDKETIEVGSFDNGSMDADDSRVHGNEGEDKKRQNKFRIKKARPAKIDYLGKINAASCEPVEREKRFKSRETSKEKKPKTGLASVFKGHYLHSGIARIISEIKNDVLKKEEYEDNNVSDHASSKGESDMGGLDDDFTGEEVEVIQEDIIYQITEFTNLCKEEKIDMNTYKFGPRKQKTLADDKSKQTVSPEKEKSTSPDKSEGKRSPRKLTLPKYTPREANWAARLREKVPLMPRQVQMVVERIVDPSDAQDQMYNFHGGAFSGAKAGRKYINNGYSVPKKVLEAKDLTQRTIEPVSQLPNLINADIVKIIKLNPALKEGSQDQIVARPDTLPNNRMGRTVNTLRKISDTMGQDATPIKRASPPKSLKSFMGLDKPRTKQRPKAQEAVSFDQRNDNDIPMPENFFMANLSLSTEQDEKEYDRSFINPFEVDKSIDVVLVPVPQVTVVQTQVQTSYVVNAALAKKKDKKLPMSFIAHKKTMRLKQKRRDQSSEGSYLV